jgi:hypothetical protein
MAGEWSLVDQFLAQAQPTADPRAAFMADLESQITDSKAQRRAAQKAARAQGNIAAGRAKMSSIGPLQPQYLNPVASPLPVQAPQPLALGPGTPAPTPAVYQPAGLPATTAQSAVGSIQQQLALGPGPRAIGPGPAALGAGPQPLAPPTGWAAPTGPSAQMAARSVAAPVASASRVAPAAAQAAAQAIPGGLARPSGIPVPGMAAPGAALGQAAALGRGAQAMSNLQGLGSLRGLASGAARAAPWAAAGMAAGQLSSAVWDDQNSTMDEGLTGALTGGGIGAGIGSVILPGVGTAIGGGLGALAGGAIGLFGEKNTGDKAVQSEFGKLSEKMNAQFDQLGIPEEVRADLYEQINMSVVMGAKSKDDVKGIFQSASALLPQLMDQYEATSQQQSRAAAIQAAILPLMQQSSRDAVASANRSKAWVNQAASYQTDPQVAALLRAQAEQLTTNANNYNAAAAGQVAAAPIFQELLGVNPQFSTQNGAPTTDTAALLAQLGI